MKKLLIVESPAKIKTIAKFLGHDFKILSTMGHVMDLPPKRLGVAMDGGITLEYEVIQGKDKTIAEIVKAAQSADEIYLAPDPDREGEIIAWHIEQAIIKALKKKNRAEIHRIAFNEITKPAIEDAIARPGEVDLHKVAAQQARRVLDRLVGYEVSPILWRKITKGLSAGRVQSVALKMICDREEAIRNFKPEEYWTIEGEFAQGKAKLIAQLTHITQKKPAIKNKKEADTVISELNKTDFIVESIEDKKRLKSPYAPFMTSTLQQAAYNQLGFSVKKTMQVAQNLYEGVPLDDPHSPVALITYMRTDSLRLSDTAIKQARSFIEKTVGKEYVPSSANVYERKSKTKAQEAHEAIRPIDAHLMPDKIKHYLTPDQATLYELIWKRFVASQMKPAEYAQRHVTVQGGKYTFKATGSTLIFDGYLKIYSAQEEEDKEDKVVIPKELKVKKEIDLKKIDPKQHFTQPPPRYTEASLVKEMEKEGIGRPSTYATILTTIRARAYTSLDGKKRFVPTELGMKVSHMLSEHLPDIMNVKFTATMEEDLDKIENGEVERDKVLKAFYKEFSKDLKAFKGEEKTAERTTITCPECKQGKLVIRFGKTGSFLGCERYPECTFTGNFKRHDDGTIELVKEAAPQLLTKKCPQCGKPLRQLVGKYGPFIACSGYPACKYIEQEKATFPCPQCGGDVVKRRWRGGTFWGCGNYPQCKFAIFGDIEETPCPQCKAPYLIKKVDKEGIITLRCGNKECGYEKKGKS